MFFMHLTSVIRIVRNAGFGIFRTIKAERCLSQKCTSTETTAGVIIIGDEILKGLTDINTPYLIKELNDANVAVSKVTVVPDDVDAIAAEVRELSSKCSFVLTSGGIGPTHDDVTYEAIAKACEEELELNENLFNHVVNYFGPEARTNPGIIKYSCIPKSAEINYVNFAHNSKVIKYPVVSVRNIYIFPGVPGLLQKCFEHFKYKFADHNKVNFTKNIFIDLDEFSLTGILNKAVEKFRDKVKFGSYPTFVDNYYKVRLVLESPCSNQIEEASKYLYDNLPKCSIVNRKEDTLLSAKDYVYSLSNTSQTVATAISVTEEALEKYSLSDICVCFNGGKDCTALLHLLYACVQHIKPGEWNKLHFLYVKCGESFEEIEYFIQNTANHYCFNLTTLDGDLISAVSLFLKSHSTVKAMFMGTRKCDPGAYNLQHFSVTDSHWPTVMRVLPLLNWTYSDVWFFLRELQIPYCVLYDRGYTSLGIKSKTVQNPLLALDDRNGFRSYKPAYMLSDCKSERNSRLQ